MNQYKWWKKNKLTKPPEVNPIEFIIKKVNWRYEKGKPEAFDSKIVFGDSTVELEKIVPKAQETGIRFSLLFTSPPYCSVTDYYADQWLRLWLLGGPEVSKSKQQKHKGRFVSRDDYCKLLDTVFGNCANIMAENSIIYVRTDKREFTFNATLEILKKHFSKHKTKIVERLFLKRTQTEMHGNKSTETGEMDIIMTR